MEQRFRGGAQSRHLPVGSVASTRDHPDQHGTDFSTAEGHSYALYSRPFQVRTSYDDLVRDTKDIIDWFHARQSRQKILCSIALDGPVALDTK